MDANDDLKWLPDLRDGPTVPAEYMAGFYGLTADQLLPAAQEIDRVLGPGRTPTFVGGRFDRVRLERYCEAAGCGTPAMIAAKLGMTTEFLDLILERAADLPLPAKTYRLLDGSFVLASLVDDLRTNLPGMRYKTFSHFDAFCKRLHEELRTPLGLSADEIFAAARFCTTAEARGSDRRYAEYTDCFTCEPLCGGHSVSLEFGYKPARLLWDVCSKRVYVENRDALREFLAAAREPDGLDAFLPAAAAA